MTDKKWAETRTTARARGDVFSATNKTWDAWSRAVA